MKSIFIKKENELSNEERIFLDDIKRFNFDLDDFKSKRDYIKKEYNDFKEYSSMREFIKEYERIKKSLRYYFDKLIERNISIFKNNYEYQIKFDEFLSFDEYRDNLFNMIIDIDFSFKEIF